MAAMERLLWALVGMLGLVMVAIFVAAYLSPDFREVAPTLAGALVGPLVTAISALGIALLGRGLKRAVGEEDRGERDGRVE